MLYTIGILKNKYISRISKFLKTQIIPKSYRPDYRLYKFNINKLRILILAAVLLVEQFLLGIFYAEPSSPLQHIYLLSSAVMLLFLISSIFFYRIKLERVGGLHQLYEVCFIAYGMVVALGRSLVFESSVSSLPTVYIAVLYGAAVIFVLNLWQSLLLYTGLTLSAVILLPVFHPEITGSSYFIDIITNGFISFVVALMNERSHTNSYRNKKHIEAINKELREQSIRDGLTGLYNRRKLDEVIGEVSLKADRYKNDFSVIMIDLDYFKKINDAHGHHTGDSVLIEFSKILEANIRDVDVCGRWGGEEFLIICQETGLSAAEGFAKRLRENVESAEFINGLKVTASFGLASWDDSTDIETLLQVADARLYEAKSGGRNRVCAGT